MITMNLFNLKLLYPDYQINYIRDLFMRDLELLGVYLYLYGNIMVLRQMLN
jgi:hypothetical protein